MSPTLIFYLCVEFIAVSLLACADSMISDTKRNFIQSDKGKFSFYRKFDIKSYHLCFVMSFLVLFLVLALRDHIGTDYDSYIRIYRDVNSYGILGKRGGYGKGIEIGFAVLCRFSDILVPNAYELMFAFMAFLTMYYLYKSIYDMSCCWYLSLCFFISFGFLHNSMNQIRQALSMMITTYAYYFLFNDKDKKYYFLYVILAGLIHKSAYFMILFYPFSKIQITRKNLLTYTLVWLSINIPFIRDFIVLAASLTSYGGYTTYGTVQEINIANVYARLCMLIGSLFFAKKTLIRNPNTVIYYNSAIICLIITNIATVANVPIFSRLASYFFMPYMFLVPEVLKSIKSTCMTIYSRKFYALLTVGFCAAYFLVLY